MKFYACLTLMLCLLSWSPAQTQADSITNIRFSHASPSVLGFGQNVQITFDYTTTEMGGVRIFARPFTNGELTPNYGAAGSPLFPVGAGSGVSFFTISGDDVTVHQVRFRMTNADQTRLLMELFVDVEYLFESHAVNNFQLTPASPAWLANNQSVSLTFDYSTSEAGGVRIFARPFTNGELTPNYAASGSGLYAAGTGTGGANFTISTGTPTVDQIRFRITDANQTVVLRDIFVDVSYMYGPHAVYNIALTPPSPTSLGLNEQLSLTFDYTTSEPGGVRIFARPFTNGALSSGYGASGSPLYPVGSGSGSGSFTFFTESQTVDHIRFQMWNDNQSALLLEFFVPVDILFAPNRVRNLAFARRSPGYFSYGEQIEFDFQYATSDPGGVRIFGRPITNENLTPNYAAHGSPLYSTGSGSGNGNFTITSGASHIDHVRIQMLNADQSALLYERLHPVNYQFLDPPSVVDIESDVVVAADDRLDQNYPNPFADDTVVRFATREHGPVRITVFDMLGRRIRLAVDEVLPAGEHERVISARDLSAGVYVYSLETSRARHTRTFAVLR